MPPKGWILRRYVPAAIAAQALCVLLIFQACTVPPLQGATASSNFLQSAESRYAHSSRIGAAEEPKARLLAARGGDGSQPVESRAAGEAEDKGKPASGETSAQPGKAADASVAGGGKVEGPSGSPSQAKPSPPAPAKPSAGAGATPAASASGGKDTDKKANGGTGVDGVVPGNGDKNNGVPEPPKNGVQNGQGPGSGGGGGGAGQGPGNGTGSTTTAPPSGTTPIDAPIGLTVALPLCAYVMSSL